MSRRTGLIAAVAVALGAGCSPAGDTASPVIHIGPGAEVDPGGATVEAGDRVVWWNLDSRVHRLDLSDGRDVDVASGEVAVTAFDRPGTYVVRVVDAPEAMAVIEVGSS